MNLPSLSIHPRVVNGRTAHTKSNTSKPPSRTTKAEKRLQRRRHAFDTQKETQGCTRPGSNHYK